MPHSALFLLYSFRSNPLPGLRPGRPRQRRLRAVLGQTGFQQWQRKRCHGWPQTPGQIFVRLGRPGNRAGYRQVITISRHWNAIIALVWIGWPILLISFPARFPPELGFDGVQCEDLLVLKWNSFFLSCLWENYYLGGGACGYPGRQQEHPRQDLCRLRLGPGRGEGPPRRCKRYHCAGTLPARHPVIYLGHKIVLFVCLFTDGFMSGRCYFFTSNWMQQTCSVFLLLGPAWHGIHSPQFDASLRLPVSWKISARPCQDDLDAVPGFLFLPEILGHQQNSLLNGFCHRANFWNI